MLLLFLRRNGYIIILDRIFLSQGQCISLVHMGNIWIPIHSFWVRRHVQKVYQQGSSECLLTNMRTPTVQELFSKTFDNRNLFQLEKRVISLHKLEDETAFTRPLSCQRRRLLPIWLWLELRPQNGRVHRWFNLGLWKIEGDGQDKRHQINPNHKHLRFGQRWWIWRMIMDDLDFGIQLWWNRHTDGQIPAPACFRDISKFR